MGTDEDKKHASLETLNQQLEAVKKLQPQVVSEPKLSGDAARAAIDFASATAVGIVLGYGLDVWLHSSPWGLLGGLLIGSAAGVKLMFREEARLRKSTENEKKKGS